MHDALFSSFFSQFIRTFEVHLRGASVEDLLAHFRVWMDGERSSASAVGDTLLHFYVDYVVYYGPLVKMIRVAV